MEWLLFQAFASANIENPHCEEQYGYDDENCVQHRFSSKLKAASVNRRSGSHPKSVDFVSELNRRRPVQPRRPERNLPVGRANRQSDAPIGKSQQNPGMERGIRALSCLL